MFSRELPSPLCLDAAHFFGPSHHFARLCLVVFHKKTVTVSLRPALGEERRWLWLPPVSDGRNPESDLLVTDEMRTSSQ